MTASKSSPNGAQAEAERPKPAAPLDGEWLQFSTMRGEEFTRDSWLVLRRRGDNIFNVFHGRKLVALGFRDATSAMDYADRRQAKGDIP